MWSIIKSVSSYLSFLNIENASEKESDYIDILKQDDDFLGRTSDSDVRIDKFMSGTITQLFEEYGLIDGELYFDLDDVDLPSNLKVGDCVSFIAFKMVENDQWQVKNIYAIQPESWDKEEMQKENSATKEKERAQHSFNANNKTLIQSQTSKLRVHIGKVSSRQGRDIIISPGDVRCNLDRINTEFLPLKGDKVQLDVHYTTDGVTETILKFNNLRPLRSKPFLGEVSHWEPSRREGIISAEIYFTKDVCEPGFIPVVKDEVIADVIESDQGQLVWRALQVIPASIETQKLPNAPRSESELNELLQNKQGIFIRQVIDVGQVTLGQEKDLEIELENGSKVTKILKSCAFCFKNTTPQFVLLHPLITDDLVIPSGNSVTFTFNARARFLGKSNEIFVWTFEGFSIGRQLQIDVQDPKADKITELKSFNGPKRNNKYLVTAKQLMATRDGFVVPGVRPIKPPSFIPVSTGVFKVPERLINAVMGAGNKRRPDIEARTYVCQGYRWLEGPLNAEVYKDRFHTLLYLEEIQNMIVTSNYDMPDARFSQTRGGFLSLEIPGLAEKRPSLIVGDKVVVRKTWDESDWKNIYTKLESDEQATMYEGYIHKVLNEEILIRFGPSFHESYNGQYSVNFYSGRMNFRRFHQAVNVASRNLTSDWLFPSSVSYQAPQMLLGGEESNSELENVSTIVTPPRENKVNVSLNNVSTDNRNKDQSELNNEQCAPSIVTGRSETFKKSEPQKIRWNSTAQLKLGKRMVARIYSPLRHKKNIQWYNNRLNKLQKQAIKFILIGKARPLPYVIFGPPGTGKTVTLVETALQILSLLPDSRLLIAAPSNSAADLIAERLLDSGLFSPGMLLRLLSHHYAEDCRLPSHLAPVCGLVDMKSQDSFITEVKTFNGIPIKLLSRQEIGHHRVTIGTCTALGILYTLGFPEGHFTHILVDEAGQATEPELLLPLNFLHMIKGQAILAGDPLQLGPVVISNLAAEFGLSDSLLARLLHRSLYSRDMIGFPDTGGYNPHLITRLVNNYRSLPEIINLPSMMFYNGDLVPLISENSEEADMLCKLNKYLCLPLREGTQLPPAVVFHGVRGSNTQSSDSPSWYNPQEVVQAEYYLEQAYECGLSPDQIGVVTPYHKQAAKIREALAASEIPVPKVGSVEEFQGQERMLVILSTVRSNMKLVQSDVVHSLGFVASPRRLNVALSRARALLIIIGDPHLLSYDNYWRTVLTYCIEHNAYIGCDLPLSLAQVGDNKM